MGKNFGAMVNCLASCLIYDGLHFLVPFLDLDKSSISTEFQAMFILHFPLFVIFLIFSVPRLFTTKIADYYEDYYKDKGVKFVKGTVLTSFEFDSSGKVNTIGLHSYPAHHFMPSRT